MESGKNGPARKQDRLRIITRTSILGILVNLAIAAVKIGIGTASASLAVISEGINNASDAGSSALTLAGTKLSAMPPDEKHPFGYGRVEYLNSLVIALLILYTGISMLKESIDGILHPQASEVSWLMIGVVAVSAVAKLVLSEHMARVGRKVESGALEAVGLEGRNDSLLSGVTIAVALLYMATGVSLDAWAGVLFSAVIIKSGLETLRDTVSELLGESGKKELAAKLYKEIRRTPIVLNAADMMLHNYGPDAYSGSVNVEIDHSKTIAEAYEVLHELQLRIMHEYSVTMVFGIYAVDNEHPALKPLRRAIGAFVKAHEHVISFHALYLDPKERRLYCDLVVDYDLRDREALEAEFRAAMAEVCPGNDIELTIETEYV